MNKIAPDISTQKGKAAADKIGRKFITAGDHPSQMEDIGVEVNQTETMAASSLLTTLTDINQAVSKVFFSAPRASQKPLELVLGSEDRPAENVHTGAVSRSVNRHRRVGVRRHRHRHLILREDVPSFLAIYVCPPKKGQARKYVLDCFYLVISYYS